MQITSGDYLAAEGGGGAQGGSILGGLITGPTTFGTIQNILAHKGGPSTKALLAASGPIGYATLAEMQAGNAAQRAYDHWAKAARLAAQSGLAAPPMPSTATYETGSILRNIVSAVGNAASSFLPPPVIPRGANVIYQNAGQPAPAPTTGPPITVAGVVSGVGDAIAAGLRIAQYFAYLRALFGDFFSSGGNGGGFGRSPQLAVNGLSPSTLGGFSMPYLSIPSPTMSSDTGFLSGIGGLVSGIGSVISAVRGGQAGSMPGGAMSLGNYNVLSNIGNTGRMPPLGAGGGGGALSIACRLGGVFQLTDGVRTAWVRKAGVPVLWSGDKTAAKRWHKCHGRRRSGGR